LGALELGAGSVLEFAEVGRAGKPPGCRRLWRPDTAARACCNAPSGRPKRCAGRALCRRINTYAAPCRRFGKDQSHAAIRALFSVALRERRMVPARRRETCSGWVRSFRSSKFRKFPGRRISKRTALPSGTGGHAIALLTSKSNRLLVRVVRSSRDIGIPCQCFAFFRVVVARACRRCPGRTPFRGRRH